VQSGKPHLLEVNSSSESMALEAIEAFWSTAWWCAASSWAVTTGVVEKDMSKQKNIAKLA
jgi:hypothetical protein